VQPPAAVRATLAAGITVQGADLPPPLLATLKHAASMPNPVFYERQRRRASTWDTPRFLRNYDETLTGDLILPRGLQDRLATLVGQAEWLRERAGGYDVAVFFTYLYATTALGLPVAASLVPTLFHPLAHDEPPFWLAVYDTTLRTATRMAYLTEEERDLVSRRLGTVVPGEVLGIGSDLDPPTADPGEVLARTGLGDRPFLAYVGRVDPAKGANELFDAFVAYKRRNPSDLALLYVGEPIRRLPAHPDVFLTGFVDEPTKHGLVARSLALVQPSYYESFSMVLTEAWALRKPALVQGACAVLRGQAERSSGAIPYEGFAELEAAIDLLVGDAGLRRAMGAAGRRYVESRYGWDVVLDRYEAVLEETAGAGPFAPRRRR